MEVWLPLEEIRQDLRYGCRIFAQAPGFTATVVLTLAFGIGANTAIFSIIQAVLLRPLPYRDPGRLVAVWDKPDGAPGTVRLFDTYGDLLAYKAMSRSFSGLAGASWKTDISVMSGRGQARDVFAVPVTADFFSLLGAKPALGRLFHSDDVDQGCSVVLSNDFWRRALAGQTGAVGASIRLSDQSCVVLGVMPPKFAFLPSDTDLWSLVTSNGDIARDPNRHAMGIFGRLKPGVTLASVSSELKLLHKEAHRTDRHARNNAPEVFPLEEEFTSLAGKNLRLSLLVLFAAVLAVLMIACVNVANLLLGHSLRRQRELSIRAALGSGRMRIMRQLLTENLLLSASAAVIGCCFAVAAVDYFHAANPVELPPGKPVEVNLSVLAFTAALSILTTLVFGLFPAWKGSQTDLNAAIKSNARGSSASLHRQRLGHALVVVEVMLSLLLLIAAGLLIRSVLQFGSAPLGFATDGILKLTVTLPPLSYASPAQRINFCDRVLNRLASMPEVREAALTTAIPSIGGSGSGVLSVEGRPEAENAPNDTGNQTVSLDYFRFFQIPLLRGREFAPSDQAHSEAVAVVNSALVREYFPHEDPLGKHLQFRGNTRTDWLLVVGVVADEKHFSHSQEMSWVSSPLIYRPLAQDPPAQLYVMTRGTGQRGVSGDAVRRELAAIDPNVPVFDVETLPHFLLHFTSYPKFRAVLLSAFAGLALLFSVVGLYGVLSQLVEQRTQEIGVRVALGAQQSQVLQLILRDGLRLIGFGLSLGLFASWAFTRFLATLLYGVGTTDSLTFGAVFLLLLAASVLAIYLPARRATRLEPVQALRYE